ncbi:hypothetical protein GGI04_005071 [Coemansia thaxteri]|uniref:P-loop containing nucleoside triphosphate hydrolase protein n=1 Tax=Coemansia thaxteri TaxID=2663907 RepID=A0A9W8EDI1_9FUNG|nr:hypothetical protein GGI04_005071 [Coemansia thaxteri]KAJ1999680.1 hypothetical protein H4R26_004962 [Coemansia thaxteri]KAJ2466278.1 hypothetical protein GGI02_004421 [Coemansia sp. RSA 2322]KAJ2474957.1 hypothetical protein EV174_005449 [Coemansia sp. RSA 2320]
MLRSLVARAGLGAELGRAIHGSASRQAMAAADLRQARSREKREEKIGTQRKQREKWDKLKSGRFQKRLDAVAHKGRSGGGQSQLLEARERRARDQKAKFVGAREFVQLQAGTQKERGLAEARILRQRSRQLKKRGTPGLGFTPARFRLLPIENEAGTQLAAVSSGRGGVMTARDVAAHVAQADFDNMGLRADVAAAARSILGDARPTEIQALGIPEILGRSRLGKKDPAAARPSVFLAAETGGGKTLAYLLPLVSQLRDEEARGAQRRERRPRALVLVPSRELVRQVTATAKRIGHVAKVRAVGLHLGMERRRVRDLADQGAIDVLVSTPGAVLRYMDRDLVLSPADIGRVVVDEADSLMDSHSFGDQMTAVLDLVRRANASQARREQAVFVSATLPKMIREQIIARFPDVVHVTTTALHRAPPKLAQTFVDVSRDHQGHRLNALWYALRTAASDKHVIVFCNNRQHANLVHRQLFRRGVPALLLVGGGGPEPLKRGARAQEPEDAPHISRRAPRDADAWEKATWYAGAPEDAATPDDAQPPPPPGEADEPPEPVVSGADVSDLKAPVPSFDRAEVLRVFVGSEPIPRHLLPALPAPANAAPSSEEGENDGLPLPPPPERKILVCTDLASRGLDTTCVTHVILFDFPTTAIDYLHRSGRTARAGTRGKVTALVGKKDRRLADQIRLAIRQGGVIN